MLTPCKAIKSDYTVPNRLMILLYITFKREDHSLLLRFTAKTTPNRFLAINLFKRNWTNSSLVYVFFNIQYEFRTSQARWPKSGEIRYTFTRRDQRWVAQKVYIAIHWINIYPVDCATGFLNTYPLDSDLSGAINAMQAGTCTDFEQGLMGSYWYDRPLLSSKTQMLFQKHYWTPTDSFFLLTRRSLYSLFAFRLANFAMNLLWIIWNLTYKFCWNDFNNALTTKLKYCCSFRFTKMWLFAYDAFPFLTTSSNHDFTILRDSFDLQE